MTSIYGPAVLIANRKAGRGAVTKAMPEIESHLKQRDLEYRLRFTEGAGHATEITREALRSGSRFIVAVGGDGTVHEVVNGMIEDDVAISPDAALGVIGAGTGCDFIRTFGIPGMAGHAVAHLDGPESFPIDIGKVSYSLANGGTETRYFANIAEAGLGAATVERAERLPRFLGPMLYFSAFWLTMGRHKAVSARVDLVDRVWEGQMNNLVVANGQYFGGGMKIAPKAAPTDGLLDVQIEHARKREAIALLPKVYKGEHVPHPDIHEAKRVRLSIQTDPVVRVEADGESLGFTPAEFEVLKDVINLKV